MERGGDWWSDWAEEWGWTAPTGGNGHHARLFQRLPFLIARQLKKGISLWNNLACMVAAAACRRRPSPCLRPFRPPVTTTLHSSSPYLSSFIFSMTFSRYQFSDKILEISFVFTHGITPAWVNHNRCFVKKCILMFRAMHEHLACNYITQITSRK